MARTPKTVTAASSAYLYLPDGRMLNAELVRLGYATGYFRFPFRYSDQFRLYEAAARENKTGLWKECSAESAR